MLEERWHHCVFIQRNVSVQLSNSRLRFIWLVRSQMCREASLLYAVPRAIVFSLLATYTSLWPAGLHATM